MKVIVFASAKGGVGKTTGAVSIGYLLGQRAATLLMDFDSQGQVALWFDQDQASSVFDWWTGTKTLENCVVAARQQGQLWLLRSNSRVKIIEKMYRDLTQEQFDGFVEMIRDLGEHFEYIVIDTPPAGPMQEVAMGAADNIVVPFKAEAPGIVGAYGTLAMLKQMKHSAQITMLPTDYYGKVNEQKQRLSQFAEAMGPERMAPAPVVHRIAVAEAVGAGQTVFEYDSATLAPVRQAYSKLRDHLVGAAPEEIEYPDHLYDLIGKPHNANY